MLLSLAPPPKRPPVAGAVAPGLKILGLSEAVEVVAAADAELAGWELPPPRVNGEEAAGAPDADWPEEAPPRVKGEEGLLPVEEPRLNKPEPAGLAAS